MKRMLRKFIQVTLLIILGGILMSASSDYFVVAKNDRIVLEPAKRLVGAWENRTKLTVYQDNTRKDFGKKMTLINNMIVIYDAQLKDSGKYTVTIEYMNGRELAAASCVYIVNVVDVGN